ncbi:MAG TPA: serine/threonine-protein kinase PknD, partial [Waddliaceae bacterium]
DEENLVYYTMPFVKGETLKQILRRTRDQQKKGKKLDHIGGSIPALIRIFITVCQAAAYAHSKGVLHRDLKLENIMLGQYGEVLILDWGLATLTKGRQDQKEETTELISVPPELTRTGKVVGTISYMSPERALGRPATTQTEIYSLGIILYYMLTLKNPFQRGTLEEFLQFMDKEVIEDPSIVAPYRDVPPSLSHMALKCLARDPAQRYLSVDALLRELENYIEGRSEWFQIAELDIKRKTDWEFQENVLIAEHIAITRGASTSDWVSLMISKTSFSENTKIEAEVTIGNNGQGVGFLLNIPEADERVHINDGYCLWIGSDINKTTKLLRSTVEVISAPEIFLERKISYQIRIEKIDHNIYFFLNDILQFSYISHLPLSGTHAGVLSRDADFTMNSLKVSIGNQNLTVNCLAVPDAFLAHKDYLTALSEYRRIGYSFPGRAEGREAIFRAGITILEQGRNCVDQEKKQILYEEALAEFEKLHTTPGAPLEYLGKAHVYQAWNSPEEEIKCYELGFRRYPNHPLLPVLQEQLLYRMHEISLTHRKATYRFILAAVKHLPSISISSHSKKLFENLQKYWELLPFIENDPDASSSEIRRNQQFGIQLAFWLAIPFALLEFIDELLQAKTFSAISVANALFCLIELGSWNLVQEKISLLNTEHAQTKEIELIQLAIAAHKEPPNAVFRKFSLEKIERLDHGDLRLLLHLAELSLSSQNTSLVHEIATFIRQYEVSPKVRMQLDCCEIWGYLIEKDWAKAENLFHQYPLTTLTQESSLLYILYGCWLSATENSDIANIHFAGVLDVTFPHTWTLLGHYLKGKISEEGSWFQKAFLWEKRQLYK